MEIIVGIIAVILVLAYVGLAIWVIVNRETIGGTIGTSVGFACGGLVIIPIAEAVATVILSILIICIAFFFLKIFFLD